MKRVLIAAFLMTATAAFATNNNGNNTTNNYNDQTYNQPGANATGNGYGGAGGSSIAGASSAAEAKANAAAIAAQQQGQQQGQAQGQQQSSTSGVKNSGNSSSASGAAVLGSGNSANDNRSTASGNKTDTNVTVTGDTVSYEAQKRDPVSSAVAYAAQPSAPCMGSSGAGGQTVGIGLSFSTTWTAEKCDLREDVRAAFNYGNKAVAEEMLRGGMPAYAAAEKRIADRKANANK